jgi:type I restriction enzyme S subunit
LEDLVAPDAPIGYGIVQVGRHVNGGVPVIAVRDLLKISVDRLHRSAPEIEAAYRRSRVKPGDVLVSVKGTTGRVGIVPRNIGGNISRDVARVRFRDDQVAEFWLQLLRSNEAQQTLQHATVGSTRQELSIAILRRLTFWYPSRAGQACIAQLLGGVDDLLEALESVVDKKRAIKHGLRQDLLTGRRRLGQLTNVVKGQQLGRAQLDATAAFAVWNGGIEPSGFTDRPNTTEDVVTVSEGGNSCGWVGRPDGPFWLGGHCYALTPRLRHHSVSFVYHALKAREPELMALRVGSGLPNVQKRRLSEYRLSVPVDRREADAIARVLGDADAEIEALTRRLEATRAIKQGMMQELLTGRTRLGGEGAA